MVNSTTSQDGDRAPNGDPAPGSQNMLSGNPKPQCLSCCSIEALAISCVGCNNLGVCPLCEHVAPRVGHFAGGAFRCVTCHLAHQNTVAKGIEQSVKNTVFGDAASFANLASTLPWLAPLQEATRSELREAHKQLTYPPTYKMLEGNGDDEIGELEKLASLGAVQMISGADKASLPPRGAGN